MPDGVVIEFSCALADVYNILYIPMPGKPLFFVGAALEDLRAFPDEARQEAGYQLHLVQLGQMPDNWKPMSSVGRGVYEIRIHTVVEHRVFYIAKYAEGVYVLHVFEKKTHQTRRADIEVGRARLKALDQLRKPTDLAHTRRNDD